MEMEHAFALNERRVPCCGSLFNPAPGRTTIHLVPPTTERSFLMANDKKKIDEANLNAPDRRAA